MHATTIAAHAVSKWNERGGVLDHDSERLVRAAEVLADDRADHREHAGDLRAR